MANVNDDIALLAIAIIASDTLPTEVELMKKKKCKSPTVSESPLLAHRNDPTCENVYTLMLRLREVIITSICLYFNCIVVSGYVNHSELYNNV